VKVTWLSPGDPAQNTGGYRYNARILEYLRGRAARFEVLALPGRWPVPDPVDLAMIAEVLADLPDGELVVADGLCWPGLGELGAALVRRCKVVVIVHSLLARETGLGSEESKALLAIELASWNGVRMLVATSRLTANEIAARSSAPCHIIIPGTDPAPSAVGHEGHTLVTVGSIVPRKAHDLLLAAVATVPVPWTLRCVGGVRDPAWARQLWELAREHAGSVYGGSRVVWLGDLPPERVGEELHRADLVLQPARYEAFGMAVAEAVARGLPVLTSPAGVVEHLPSGAVQVVDGEAPTWGAAIHWFLTDNQARRTLAARALAAARTLPTWEEQGADWYTLLESL
jgi:glycosyltransferase involved in cell wall biosynthesis